MLPSGLLSRHALLIAFALLANCHQEPSTGPYSSATSLASYAAMCVYSALFARFAWMIQPRNYLLLACHISNETVQLNQLRRWASVQPWAAVSRL